MIYGETTLVKAAKKQAKILGMIKGVRRFALFPTKLKSGETVWLQHYWAYYRGLRQGSRGEPYYSLWSNGDAYCYLYFAYIERHGKPVKVDDYYVEEGHYVQAQPKDMFIETELR